ncbi:MAG: YbbR-like domain-containing protein, partial [bacterium]
MDWQAFFFKNYKIKIVLFLMAVFLWFFVIASRDYDQTLDVPIRVINLKPEMVFLEEPPSAARVRFQGRGNSLLLLSLFGDVHLEVDIRSVNDSSDISLNTDLVLWASGINVNVLEIISPKVVYIRLDDEAEQTLPVHSLLTVKPAESFVQVGAVVCQPESVLVCGPKTVLNHLQFIPTQAKTIEQVAGNLSMKLDLILPAGARIIVEPSSVKATAVV